MHIAFVSTSCALSALLPLSILSCCASHSPTLSPRFHQIAGISLEILDVRYAIVKYREGKNSPFFNIHFLSFSSNYFLAFSSTMNFSQPSIIYIYIYNTPRIRVIPSRSFEIAVRTKNTLRFDKSLRSLKPSLKTRLLRWRIANGWLG